METSLERELREWRENRSRTHAALAEERDRLFSSSVPARGARRLNVNGHEVVVVSKQKRH